jgi:hypothetical protein
MKAVRIFPLLAILFLSMGVASVFASGYTVGVPILGTTGAPALTSSMFSGEISVLYADGLPVVLSSYHLTFELCASTCMSVNTILKQLSPGVYAYTFIPPTTLTGIVTIYVTSGSLADDNGKIFPSVDTQVGTYALPSSSASSVPSDQNNLAPPPAVPSAEIQKAVNQTPALPQQASQQTSPAIGVLSILSLLVAVGLVIVLTRRY